MAENFQIRDVFNPAAVNALADRIQNAWPSFDHRGFCRSINARLPELTYSERLKLISRTLDACLPDDFPGAVDILLKAQLPTYLEDGDLSSNDRFITVPQSDFIGRNGLGHFDISMRALYEMTRRFSSEFAIRPFLEKYPDETLAVMRKWAGDPDPHVRRLVSEGSRPLLPWGMRLQQFVTDPTPTLSLLELLKNDPSENVRRSVANHLNDHSKNHPDRVVETLKNWKSGNTSPEMEKLIRHATRTLVKKGHPGALALLGFEKGAPVTVRDLSCSPVVPMGDYLQFAFDLVLNGERPHKLVIDYAIHFVKADGYRAPKVFKMTTRQLDPGSAVRLEKRHPIRPITTRTYYAGEHMLAIHVNGEEQARTVFHLKTD